MTNKDVAPITDPCARCKRQKDTPASSPWCNACLGLEIKDTIKSIFALEREKSKVEGQLRGQLAFRGKEERFCQRHQAQEFRDGGGPWKRIESRPTLVLRTPIAPSEREQDDELVEKTIRERFKR